MSKADERLKVMIKEVMALLGTMADELSEQLEANPTVPAVKKMDAGEVVAPTGLEKDEAALVYVQRLRVSMLEVIAANSGRMISSVLTARRLLQAWREQDELVRGGDMAKLMQWVAENKEVPLEPRDLLAEDEPEAHASFEQAVTRLNEVKDADEEAMRAEIGEERLEEARKASHLGVVVPGSQEVN